MLHLFDITDDERTCKEYSIFSPTMTIVNEKHRWHGPFTKDQILLMLEDEMVRPETRPIDQSDDIVRGDLVTITPESVLQTCTPCIGMDDKGLCYGKSEWIADVMKDKGLRHLGYLHFVDGKCVGGAEFLPSKKVPYPIPDKRDDNAFLTCSYVSSETKDFKSHPLEKLVEDLKEQGFVTLSVAASEHVVLPNGPKAWFERKGFVDKGVLSKEGLHGAEIHYLQLDLVKG